MTLKKVFLNHSVYIVEVGRAFNVFSYEAVWTEHRTHYLPEAERIHYVLSYRRGLVSIKVIDVHLPNKQQILHYSIVLL